MCHHPHQCRGKDHSDPPLHNYTVFYHVFLALSAFNSCQSFLLFSCSVGVRSGDMNTFLANSGKPSLRSRLLLRSTATLSSTLVSV